MPVLRHYILNPDNTVAIERNVLAWAKWFEHANRVVGYTQINSQCKVSTVFLGLDHRHFGGGPPLLFETMIFGGPDDIDHECWRYSTWDDAEMNHNAIVRKVRERLGQRVG